MKFDGVALFISEHAHEQYCARVHGIGRFELHKACLRQIEQGDYHTNKEFMQLEDVWWIFAITEGVLNFVTCYGRSHLYLPKALTWAAIHHDRIDLKA